METKEAIKAVIEQDGLERAVEWIAGVVDEKHSRIEALEAALRGIAYILPKTDSNGVWWHQKVARLALGEKEDEQPMG